MLGVESTKMVAFNTLTSGHINLCLNQLNKLICDLHELYPLQIILLGVFLQLLWRIWAYQPYFMPIILLGVECTKIMVAFNALTSGDINSCLNQLKELICDLHELYPLPLILLSVECTKMVAFNALTSGPMDSCLYQLNNSFAIFTHNLHYQS